MEPYGLNAVSIDVGQRLRTLREERGISIRALARESGLSANALSMIERGLTSPSVSTLVKLANALLTPITAFFRVDSAREKVVFRKASQRSRVPFHRGMLEGLGSEAFAGRVDAFLLTLENGGGSGSGQMLHSGSELIFCLRGKLEFEVDGKSYLLEPGDTLIFSSMVNHRYSNPGTDVANAIVVISSFEADERPSEFDLAAVMANGEEEDDGSHKDKL